MTRTLEHSRYPRVAYLRAERFVNDFVQSVAEGDAPAFRERYRALDFVCVGHLHVLAGKGRTQQAP